MASSAKQKEKISCDRCGRMLARGSINEHKRSIKCKSSKETKINMPLDAPMSMYKDFPMDKTMDDVRKHFEQYGYDLDKHLI
jgi:phage FluMu protein Com